MRELYLRGAGGKPCALCAKRQGGSASLEEDGRGIAEGANSSLALRVCKSQAVKPHLFSQRVEDNAFHGVTTNVRRIAIATAK